MREDISRDLCVDSENQPWTPEIHRVGTYGRASVPSISSAFRSQRRYLEAFPVLCQVRNRINRAVLRVEDIRGRLVAGR